MLFGSSVWLLKFVNMTIVTKTEKVDQKLRFSGNQNHWVFINDLIKEKRSLFFIGVNLVREVERETR